MSNDKKTWAMNASNGKWTTVVHCNRCGEVAAWAKSKRTGKSYLCEALHEYDRWIAFPYKPHKCGA